MAAPTVLVVDDDKDILNLITLRFQQAGAEVRGTTRGDDALAIVCATLTLGQPFSLIVLDVRMPEKNGNVVAREIRELGHTGPIVGFTAVASATGRRVGTDAGMDMYISKELLTRELIQALLVQHNCS